MTRFLSITLIVCLLGQAFIRTAWTLHYQWNRAQYMALCENLYKPELDCGGKCSLKKEIAVSENSSKRSGNEPQLPGHFQQFKDALLFFDHCSDLPVFITPVESVAALPPYVEFLPTAPGHRIFKPPSGRA